MERAQLFRLLYQSAFICRHRLVYESQASELLKREIAKQILVEKIPHLVEMKVVDLFPHILVNMVSDYDDKALVCFHCEEAWQIYRTYMNDSRAADRIHAKLHPATSTASAAHS